MKKSIQIIFSFLLFFNISFGQSLKDSLKAINPTLLKEDFTVFRKSLQKTHPDLYRYTDKKVLDNLFDSCYLTLNRSKTEVEFYSVIKFLLSSIGDGHLSCDPATDFRKYYAEYALVFPIQIRFIKEKAFVFCSSKEIIPNETQILAINGNSVDKIRRRLFQYIVSDGGITTNKYWVLNNSFWFYYHMIYGLQSAFNIKYKTKDGMTGTLILNADLKRNIECGLKNKIQEKKLRLTYKANDIALLTISTFRYDEITESKEDYVNFLQTTFKEIKDKQIKKLIIDLRGNGGGRDVYGSLLYSYLTNKEFTYYASLETSSRKLTKEDHPNLEIQKPNENNFLGQVFFLIDGLSFSTTAEFCSVAKSNNRGKFVGEETGGGYYGNISGNFADTLLPNSKITIYIPTTKYVMAVKKVKYKDRGVIPDYILTPTISDIIKNKDVQLNFAVKLASQQ